MSTNTEEVEAAAVGGTPTEGTAASDGPSASASGTQLPEECRVRVHNLSPGITEQQLLQLFATYGDVTKVYVVRDNNARPLSAYITYTLPETAAEAMRQLDGSVQLQGAPLQLYVHPARDVDAKLMDVPPISYSRLYFHGFPSTCSVDDLIALFRQYGRVCTLSLSAGVRGTVTMGTTDEAIAAIEGLDNTSLSGTGPPFMRVNWAEMKVSSVSKNCAMRGQRSANSSTVKYAGIPRNVPPTLIAGVFGRFGQVLRVTPYFEIDAGGTTSAPSTTDRCGLVVMGSEQAAKDAVAALHSHFIWPGARSPLQVQRMAPSHAIQLDNGNRGGRVHHASHHKCYDPHGAWPGYVDPRYTNPVGPGWHMMPTMTSGYQNMIGDAGLGMPVLGQMGHQLPLQAAAAGVRQILPGQMALYATAQQQQQQLQLAHAELLQPQLLRTMGPNVTLNGVSLSQVYQQPQPMQQQSLDLGLQAGQWASVPVSNAAVAAAAGFGDVQLGGMGGVGGYELGQVIRVLAADGTEQNIWVPAGNSVAAGVGQGLMPQAAGGLLVNQGMQGVITNPLELPTSPTDGTAGGQGTVYSNGMGTGTVYVLG